MRGAASQFSPRPQKGRCPLAAAFLEREDEGCLALWGQTAWAGVCPCAEGGGSREAKGPKAPSGSL